MTSLSDAGSDGWQRPIPSPQGRRGDAILALVILLGATVSLLLYSVAEFYDDPAPWYLDALYLVGITAPLAVRRRWPEAVALIVAVVFVASQMLEVPELLFSNIALFIALYTVGAWSNDRRRATVVRAVIVVGMFVWLFFVLVDSVSDPTSLPGISRAGAFSPLVAFWLIQVLTNLLYFGGAWYFGDRARVAARERAVLEERTAELAAERALTARQAVAGERLRIARELHDVIAHHVSVMGVQAGAARLVLSRDPAKAERSLGAIEANARTAVDELHRMLTTLRDEGQPDAASDSPTTHNIDQLEDLVEEARQAGLAVEVTLVGTPRPVPGTVGSTVYRLTQESLTNVVKHAGAGTAVDLRLRYLDDEVELEVSDDGRPRATPAGGTRLGHVGMRERVAAVGGRIEIGPRSRGGYRVRATLPTAPARPTDTVTGGQRTTRTSGAASGRPRAGHAAAGPPAGGPAPAPSAAGGSAAAEPTTRDEVRA